MEKLDNDEIFDDKFLEEIGESDADEAENKEEKNAVTALILSIVFPILSFIFGIIFFALLIWL